MIKLSLFLGCLVLAGCSAEKHPTDDQLKAFLGTLAPQLVDVESIRVRFSPMRQMLGNTLPDGSVQAVCKVTAKLKQDLYVKADQADPDNSQAKLIIDLEKRKKENRDQWLKFTNYLNIQDRNELGTVCNNLWNYPEKVIIFQKSRRGFSLEFNASILAIPQVDSWKFQFIDSDLASVGVALGLPKEANFSNNLLFTLPVVVSGSPEASAYLEGYRAVLEKYESTERKVIEKYRKLLKVASEKCLSLLERNVTLRGTLNDFSSYNVRAGFSLKKDNEGTLTLGLEQGKCPNPAIFEVRVVTPASAQSDLDVVSGVLNTVVLVLKDPGCLRELPKTFGAFGDLTTGGPNGYLRIDGNQLLGTTAGTITYNVSFTLP